MFALPNHSNTIMAVSNQHHCALVNLEQGDTSIDRSTVFGFDEPFVMAMPIQTPAKTTDLNPHPP